MCNTVINVLLSNIIVLFTGLRNKLPSNLKKDSRKTGRQTKTCNQNKERDLDRASNDGACNNISDEMLKLSTTTKSAVIDSLGRLGSPSTGSLNAMVVLKNSVIDWLAANKVEEDQTSLSKKSNIPNIVGKSTGDLVAQSAPKNVHPVSKEPRNRTLARTSKQQGPQPECTCKPSRA
ncbi:unnamed protein product [Schistosoma curassoni]|uniref:Ion_trans domain-containing protein n=1 Tax=Schistosoma curassoni TaxID=6186 RepID=A0A183KUL0_9TREM|nr:unnamed protein product [Schistosoma curassoni]